MTVKETDVVSDGETHTNFNLQAVGSLVLPIKAQAYSDM